MDKIKNPYLEEMDGYKFKADDKDSNHMFFLKCGMLEHVAEDHDRDRLCQIYTEMLSQYLDKPEITWFESFAFLIIKRVYTSTEMSDDDKLYLKASHIVNVMEEYKINDLMRHIKMHFGIHSYLEDYNKEFSKDNTSITAYDWGAFADWYIEKYTPLFIGDIEAEIIVELSEFIVYCLRGRISS